MKTSGHDAERLYELMKIAFPHAVEEVKNGERPKPEATAQLARQYAQAMFEEWQNAVELRKQ